MRIESAVPITGVNSAPVGVCMIAPSLISNWLRITLVYMAIPLATLNHASSSSEHVRIKELFAAESRGLRAIESRKKPLPFWEQDCKGWRLAKAAIKAVLCVEGETP